ncbi:hypothetical protein AJ80_01017 [Polytolypa hystricis UAMH7299]|uniref:BRCA1-associated protein n=1 Tax=Polytolypa hystricis (strain UAMH7299) TaxID=1447883 RepID=A0A2B7Z3A1_POLH7|nr:hypothetical protein AJ80_01017 [Polytolypa hystricis UAMH7299]
MPAYFYHIRLEFLTQPPSHLEFSGNSHQTNPSRSSLVLESVHEALRPFEGRRKGQNQHSIERSKKNAKSTGVTPRSESSKVSSLGAKPNSNSREPVGALPLRQCQASPPENAASSSASSLQYQQQQHHHSAYDHRYRKQPEQPTRNATDCESTIPPFPAIHPSVIGDDARVDQISVESVDMVAPEQNHSRKSSINNAAATNTNTTTFTRGPSNNNQIAKGIGTNVIGGLATKGRYVPLDRNVLDSVWGIVHLYRDAQESASLYKDDDDPSFLKGSSLARNSTASIAGVIGGGASNRKYGSADVVGEDVLAEDCTTLCILAVPSYLAPSDFLGFVGEETRDEVSHFRMIRTARANRYMVLMKFRSGKKAREWQREWNGKVFNSMEPETCHVVFVKTVEIQIDEPVAEGRFPDMSNDPFTPANPALIATNPQNQPGALASTSLSTKPLAPPTPSLIELPTCPVCLERMDETTGLLTIICQHVFHCTCLQKWKGSGCPVCRYTQEDFGKRRDSFGFNEGPTECNVCHSEENLWLCLICGHVGCGRYDEAHAFAHFKQTSHAFAMDLSTQRVWDYVGDGYVHRIIQNKSDGKLVELPAADHSALDPPDWADAVPREKLENMGVEYTHLLTSQLESQRTYFEEKVERAADKASEASAAAAAAQEAAEKAVERLVALHEQHDSLIRETIPTLERDKGRAERRAEKFETMARNMEKEWREEKAMNTNLLERVELLNTEVEKLKAANQELSEQNRDLTFFISGSERLKGHGEDVVEGTVSIPEEQRSSKKKKGKGRAKG